MGNGVMGGGGRTRGARTVLKTAGEFAASGKAEAAGEAPATRTWSWVSVTPEGPRVLRTKLLGLLP